MSKRNFKNDRGGHVVKIVCVVVLIALLSATITSGVAFASKGFTNTDVGSWFSQELNEDNLIKYENYVDSLKESEGGIKLKWKEDGKIILSGKYEPSANTSDDYYKYAFTTVELAAGTYTLSTGNKNASESEFGLHIRYNDGDVVTQKYIGDKAYTFTVDEATTVQISVFVKKDIYLFGIQSYIEPTLVAGETAGEFYK